MPRVAAAKHDEYAEARRDQILEAALHLFSRKGFAESSVDEIAAEAGLGKATLYLYFPSKEILLQKLVDRYRLAPDLGELVDSIRHLPPVRGIPLLVEGIWRQIKEHKEVAHVLVREVFSNPERARLYTEQIRLPGRNLLGAYFEAWMKRGKMRRGNAEAMAQCLFGMLWYFLQSQELMGGKELAPLSDEVICTTTARIFLDGAAIGN
ncbi:MAG TPA: TetR/AcrR family transcriptional regulator [Candidatus Binataceae bacterium]|nr:TetR/AcrR family transcriptional regulator [Candidatus Binataceae bacterium]